MNDTEDVMRMVRLTNRYQTPETQRRWRRIQVWFWAIVITVTPLLLVWWIFVEYAISTANNPP